MKLSELQTRESHRLADLQEFVRTAKAETRNAEFMDGEARQQALRNAQRAWRQAWQIKAELAEKYSTSKQLLSIAGGFHT